MDANTRIVALVDMDCFYVQVEQRSYPDFWGKHTAVVQYNPFYKGGIIAVGYEARAKGIKRGMMRDEALELCPDLNLVTVPCQRNKADLTKYRNASQEVFAVLNTFENIVVERASIDEAYLDLTDAVDSELKEDTILVLDDFPTSHLAIGGRKEFETYLLNIRNEYVLSDKKLFVGAKIMENIRRRILDDTKFHCSAGVAHNKMLAKLICSLHKPKHQTVLPSSLMPELFSSTPIQNIRMLGGKLGRRIVEEFSISTMAELSSIQKSVLAEKFGENTAQWLKNLSHGIDTELVSLRQLSKSVGCSKNFPSRNSLKTKSEVAKWLLQLAEELEERIISDQQSNRRVARTLVVGIQTEGDASSVSSTRQTALSSYSANSIVQEANRLLRDFNVADKSSNDWKPPLINLSLAAGKFEDNTEVGSRQITNFFKKSLPSESLTLKLLDTDESSIDKTPIKTYNEKNATTIDSKTVQCPYSPENALRSPKTKVSGSSLFTDLKALTVEKSECGPKNHSNLHESGPSGSQVAQTSGIFKQSDLDSMLVCPPSREEIDPEVWRNLTPQIRFELISFYKKQEKKVDIETKKVEHVILKKKEKSATISSKARAKNSKVMRATRIGEQMDRSARNGATLLDFYDKL